MRRLTLLLLTAAALQAQHPHIIHILDESTRRGVPLIELCTTSAACYLTDSAGVITLDEPAYSDKKVSLSIHTHGGYAAPNDHFGNPTVTLHLRPGASSTIRLRRTQPAERLYRATGEGIYRDSLRAGLSIPAISAPSQSRITGLDTVMHAPYRGALFWIFGDTNDLSAPLGNFAATAARSPLLGQGTLDPEQGIRLDYITRTDGFAAPAAALPGKGLKWLYALMTLPDPSGAERLLARYDRHKSLTEVADSGLALFNDRTRQFEPLVSFGPMPLRAPHGRPTRANTNGRDYFYFAWPQSIPSVRVPATWSAIQDLTQYEAYTCTPEPCRWTRDAKPHSPPFTDAATGRTFPGHATSVYWNAYRHAYLAIVQGSPGDVYIAEAPAPEGPYSPARLIIHHDNYNFYWPTQLPYYDRDNGRRILIMGTYTKSFSSAPAPTPRYDYNQLVYALSLDDPRLALPIPPANPPAK